MEENEVMEPMVVEDNNVEVYEENSDSCEKKSSLGLILAGAAAVGAVGTLLYRKLRKKTGKKKKLMWVEIPDEEEVVEPEEETEVEASEEE